MEITLQAEFGYLVEISQVIEVATLINIAESAQGGGGGSGDWADITGKPSTFPPSAHSHAKSAVGLGNVDNTSDVNKPISAATQTALDAKQDVITAGTTGQYWRGDKTFQTLDKSAVGLGNVDNTSDVNKPISAATQTALDAKQDVITAGTSSQYYRGDKTFQTLDKTAVGLGNVDNTSDANKPISTATQDALDAKQPAGLYLTGNQTITFSGDVTGSGTTSVTLTIANNAVTLAKLATVSTATFLGRTTAGTGNVEALTATQATALLNTATSSAKGLAPATGTATNVKFLRDDMTYTASAQSWEAFQEKAVWFQDLFNGSVLSGWSATGNSGSIDTSPSTADNSAIQGSRLGLALVSSGAGSNTGYSWNTTGDAAQLCSTPLKLRAAVAIHSASASVLKLRFGLGIAFNANDATNQIACEINGTTFTGRVKTGASSTTSSSYTMTAGTWYTIELVIPPGGGSVIFTVYNGATGASLFTETLTTNIPGAGIYLYPAFALTNGAGSGVTKLATLDNLYYERNTLGRA